MRIISFLLCFFLTFEVLAQGEGGYTAPPITAFSQGLLTNVNAAGWTNALGIGGGSGGSGIPTLNGAGTNLTVSSSSSANLPLVVANSTGGSVVFVGNTGVTNFVSTVISSNLTVLGTVAGNGSGLTNVNISDGGTTGFWGSSNAMNPLITRPLIYANGSTTGFNAGNDGQVIAVNEDTNFGGSGTGWASSVMGGGIGGTGGANIINLVAGLASVEEPTNRYSQLIPGYAYNVWSPDSVNTKGMGWCAPGFGGPGITPDSGNYLGWTMDSEHGYVGCPLIDANELGVYQPDDVVYDFTVSGVTTAPTFEAAVYSNNGHFYSVYSNSVAAGSGHIMATCAYGAPLASGTLTKVTGTGDATIAFSASASLRTWHWGIQINPTAGWLLLNSNLVMTGNGHLFLARAPTAQNGVNIFATSNSFSLQIGSGDGIALQNTRGIESLAIGDTQDYVGLFTSAAQGWNSAPSFDVGTAAQLDDGLNIGSAVIYANGAFGSDVKTKSGDVSGVGTNYTLTMSDSLILDNSAGTLTNTLPSAASHSIGRVYAIKNTGATNSLILTTSSQTIDGQTSITLPQFATRVVQGNGANWQRIGGTPGLLTTNFVSGQIYTNTYGAIIEVSANATLAATGVSGNASLSLLASGYRTNYVGMSTLVTSIAMNYTNAISMVIPAGQSYTFTNTSAGAGDSASVLGGQILVY